MNSEEINTCPFCGAKAENHPNSNTAKEYYILYHNKNCYFLINNSTDYTLISKKVLYSWNKRTTNSDIK